MNDKLHPAVAEHLLEENVKLRELLDEAVQEIEAWGAYASDYFQQKHDLAGTVARFKAALSQQDEPDAPKCRDWTEDSSHENGNYFCRCCQCGEQFVGHKRRFVCKLCDPKAEPAPAQDEPVYQLQRLGAPAGWRDADKEAYDSAAKMDGYLRRTLYRRPAQTAPQPVGWAEFVEKAAILLNAEQARLCDEDYLMDHEDCITVLREHVTALSATPSPAMAAKEV